MRNRSQNDMSISFYLQCLQLHISFYLSGIGGCFIFRLPLVRRLPFQIQIFLYVVVKLLLILVIYSIYRSSFVLLMDDLTRAVAQFLPGSGGININEEFNSPPPGPSDNSFFVAPASSDGLERDQGVIDTRSSSKNLRDPSLIKNQLREKSISELQGQKEELAELLTPLIEEKAAGLARKKIPTGKEMVELIIEKAASKKAKMANQPGATPQDFSNLKRFLTRVQKSTLEDGRGQMSVRNIIKHILESLEGGGECE